MTTTLSLQSLFSKKYDAKLSKFPCYFYIFLLNIIAVMNDTNLSKKKFSSFIAWNIVGQIAPMMAALISIPILIDSIGISKFGMITLAWMLIGYFSLFDFGIGRALTQLISRYIAEHNPHKIPTLIWTGITLTLILGCIASLILIVLSYPITYQWLNIPLHLQSEASTSLMVLAPAIPFTIFATAARGILEAYQEFKATNMMRIPLGIFMFIAPILVLPFSHSLVAIFFALGITRLLTALCFLWLCTHKVPNFWQISIHKKAMFKLLRFGGWMTVSNIISPIMVQMDRFFIGAILSISVVAYYTTPYEIITKILIIPAAIAGVAFPQFALLHSKGQWQELYYIYKKSLLYTSVLALPTIVAILGSPYLLTWWLNPTFAKESSVVMQILAFGVFINGLAHIPYTFIQGIGQPKITAILHCIEVVIYIPILIILIKHNGINGAAYAWLIRVCLDAFFLFYIARLKILSPITTMHT